MVHAVTTTRTLADELGVPEADVLVTVDQLVNVDVGWPTTGRRIEVDGYRRSADIPLSAEAASAIREQIAPLHLVQGESAWALYRRGNWWTDPAEGELEYGEGERITAQEAARALGVTLGRRLEGWEHNDEPGVVDGEAYEVTR